MKVLELFSGTGSVGKICKEKNWDVTSLDLKNADINTDILNWDYKQFEPKYFDIIWASPPCNTFSKLQCAIKTKEQILININERGLPLLNKTLEIIDYFQPKYYFIENPQTGKMKEYILDKPFYDVDYCRYSNWGYKKRTRIWTNRTDFIPLLCDKNCGNGFKNNNRYYHNNNSAYQSIKQRYSIPPNLIKALFNDIS
jgi:site-specific DNA-cytosine methylase